MATECHSSSLDFPMVGPRQVLADLEGGAISCDGGALLLRKAEPLTGIIRQFAARFTDPCDPDLIEHTVTDLVAQRAYAPALGYEDLDDLDDLRRDPLLATVVGKAEPEGEVRRRRRDRGKAPAGKSTLNRLESTPVGAGTESRYEEVTCRTRDVERLLVDLSLQAHERPPERIVLDLDATDDPIHGHRLGRFSHGYLLRWCEGNGVDDIIGLAKDTRRTAAIAAELERVRQRYEATSRPARAFAELRYQARETWSRERRVVAKAEHLAKGPSPRFVVTSRPAEDRAALPLDERDDCGRGEMEGRIKEQQLPLFADRTGAHTMRANQVRLSSSSIAYVLLEALRRLGLSGTGLAEAPCQAIRLKLLKIGALVRMTVREVWVKLSSGCPNAEGSRRVHANLDRRPPWVRGC